MFSYKDTDGKISRIAYIAEAALEYFVSLLCTEAYLTNILNELGFSTAVQGIISSIVSLAFIMEVVAVLTIRKRSGSKRMCTLLLLFDQLCFSLIYFTPFFGVPTKMRSFILVAVLFTGYSLQYIAAPFRSVWMMSNVKNENRGVFTAWKEIVSLASGYLFTFVMARIIDSYEANGELKKSFIVCGFTIIGITIPHLVSCLLIKERNIAVSPKISFGENLKRSFSGTIGNSSFRKVTVITMLYYVGAAANHYSGNYERNALGFSMTFISMLTLGYSIFRSIASIPLGKFADKHSWEKMLRFCYFFTAIAYVINTFTTPACGKVTFTVFYMMLAVAMGGMNSGLFNLMFEYADANNRTNAIAWNAAFGGLAGFGTSLLEAVLVSYIEKNGNKFLGLSVYPQQVLYAISAVIFSLLGVYCYFVIRNLKKQNEDTIPKESEDIPAEV